MKNPDHSNQLNDLIMRIKGDGYFEKLDREQIQSKKKSKIENQFKKVRFYQNQVKNYMIPADLKKYLEIKDEKSLLEVISKDVEKQMQKEVL